MPKPPTTTALLRQLTDIVKRMDAFEVSLKEMGMDVAILKRWHEDTEFAKRILEEYEEKNPGAKDTNNNGKAIVALTTALAALTAVVLALK